MKIYQGPSEIDGQEIVAILLPGSTNTGTGDMAQLYILHANEAPHVAQKSGNDKAVCGQCPSRPANGGGCYVVAGQGANATWKAHKGAPVEMPKMIFKPLRFGAYGDPLALPRELLEKLIDMAEDGFTGYTHQWGKAKNQWAKAYFMASTESQKSLERATGKGWEVFHIVHDLKENPEIESCPKSFGAQCEFCLACNATKGSRKITAHGSQKKKIFKS